MGLVGDKVLEVIFTCIDRKLIPDWGRVYVYVGIPGDWLTFFYSQPKNLV